MRRAVAALLAWSLIACAGTAPAQPLAPPPAAAAPADSLGPPPTPGSAEDRADLAVVLWLQRTRTADDVARAGAHQRIALAAFAPALGAAFAVERHARTELLLKHALDASYTPVRDAKRRWGRPRPYVADPRVTPAVEREESFSYPSGHATRGVLAARILAELAPDRRAELLRTGEQVGYDRVVGGVHYPTDVLAGQRLGHALADALLASPEFTAELREVRAAEWATGPAASP